MPSEHVVIFISLDVDFKHIILCFSEVWGLNSVPVTYPTNAKVADILNLFIAAMGIIYSWVLIEVLPDQCLIARSLSESKSLFLKPLCSIVDFTVYICINDKRKSIE